MYIYLPETKWKSVEFEALIGPLSHGGYPPSSPVEKSETGHPWRLDDDWGWWLGQLHTHDGSMVLVYMLTKMGYIDGKCYHIWQHHGSYGILIIIILDYSMAKGSVKTMGSRMVPEYMANSCSNSTGRSWTQRMWLWQISRVGSLGVWSFLNIFDGCGIWRKQTPSANINHVFIQ